MATIRFTCQRDARDGKSMTMWEIAAFMEDLQEFGVPGGTPVKVVQTPWKGTIRRLVVDTRLDADVLARNRNRNNDGPLGPGSDN